MPDYAVHIDRKRDDLFIATFPDIPDAVAFGRDSNEVLQEAGKSLQEAIRRRILNDEELPAPEATGPIRLHQEVLAAVLA